ncbi:MAG: hypothetical protein ACLRYB_18305 [Segatella copri]
MKKEGFYISTTMAMYAIVTPDFIWRMSAEKLKAIVRELTGIVQDVEDLKDMEVRL